MSDEHEVPVPVAAPSLPAIDSPAPEAILDGAPSVKQVIENARSADDVVKEQPTVSELLDGDDGVAHAVRAPGT